MSVLQRTILALVLLFTGLSAGLQVLMLMGVLPAVLRMPLATYVGMWQAIDHLMAARMPVFANGGLLLIFIAIGSFARSPRGRIFWALVGCLALVLADIVFTVTQQLPINRAVQALDTGRLTDLTLVQQLRDATIQHFYLRGFLSIAAFILLGCAIVFSLDGRPLIRPEGSNP